MAMDCMAWSVMPTEPWTMPLAPRPQFTPAARSWRMPPSRPRAWRVTGGMLLFGFSWLFIRTQLFDPQNSLRNVHVEALRIIVDHTLCGSPYTTRNNMENPHANCFG